MNIDPIAFMNAIILGLVEGLTEFLPVSSTGHLILAGSLLGYDDEQAKVFEIVIQLAAILAVCWFYRERIVHVILHMWDDTTERRFTINILVAFIPAIVLGAGLHDAIKTYLFNPLTVAGALVVGGIAILVIERMAPKVRFETIDDIGWKEALKVGFMQCLALFPGVSRSGATIMGGLVFGLSRRAATEMSFFLAIPTMLAATVYDVYKARNDLVVDDLAIFAVGSVAAFLSAMVTIKALLRFVSSHSFEVFAWYRIVFGLIILGTAYTGLVNW